MRACPVRSEAGASRAPRAAVLPVLWLAALACAGAAPPHPVARFTAGDIEGWQEKSFNGHTRYLSADGGLRAESRAAASGLYRELAVDLGETPMLIWSWKLGHGLHARDERTRAGDDYPLRVYVVFSGGLAFWRTRAINYVWASTQPAGAEWPNAFTANARMIALESGPARGGEWIAEARDVRADYRRLFGAEPPPVAAVALMTDTDDTAGEALAWYGDIVFAAAPVASAGTAR